MRCRIAVGIPTVGRAPILCDTLLELTRQTRCADQVIICGSNAADLEGAIDTYPGLIMLTSKAGLPRQRNAIIEAAPDADIILFLDDDFLPDTDYLAVVEQYMLDHPRVVIVTGLVLADGIGGPGLSAAEGRMVLSQARPAGRGSRAAFSGYGCNMALRMQPMRAHELRFDERLPLYGWQEDVDLSRRLAAFGDIVQLDTAHGVHLGVKRGRGSGVRLGYSQVANPLYLAGKRCGYPFGRAGGHILRNMAMNFARAWRPESYVDRRGRLLGNFLAWRDLLVGRLAPERILEL